MAAIIKNNFFEVYNITIVRIIIFETVIKIIIISVFIVVLKHLIY